MNILAIGAHPDDLELCCFGTLALCVIRGDTVVVCSTTNGNKGSTSIPSDQLRLVRMKESVQASTKIGASYCTLDVQDTQMDGCDQTILLQLTELIRSVAPNIIITHSPIDYHPDHIETSKAVFTASFYATVNTIITKSPALMHLPQIYYMDTFGGSPRMPAEFVDITSVFSLKKEALECHVSQLSVSIGDNIPLLMHSMETVASYRGIQCLSRYAEGFFHCQCRPIPAQRMLP